MKPVQCWQSNTRKAADPFPKGDIFVCCDAALKARFRGAATRFPVHCSVFGPLAEAARSNLGLAGSFAALGSLASVNAAGKPIDQPQILFVGTFHTREPGSDSRNQRRQQDCRGDHGCADQDGHRVSDTIRRGSTIPLIVALSFRRLKQGPGRLRCLCFFWRAISLSAHLADFLFAHRRPGDRFATATSSANAAQ
jgi:hypothetical protein